MYSELSNTSKINLLKKCKKFHRRCLTKFLICFYVTMRQKDSLLHFIPTFRSLAKICVLFTLLDP